MNDYGFDYFNYMNNITPSPNYMNATPNYNNINVSPNYPNMEQGNMYKVEVKKNPGLLDPYEGFIRGNSFDHLYDKYKNYSPSKLNPTNEREALLYQLLQYKFAITDLNLYLDTNPNDKETLTTLKKYLAIENQIKNKYESMYGPLTISDINPNSKDWNWINSPWPWEGV